MIDVIARAEGAWQSSAFNFKDNSEDSHSRYTPSE